MSGIAMDQAYPFLLQGQSAGFHTAAGNNRLIAEYGAGHQKWHGHLEEQ
jgi:hypothetical protein